jgi:hypothetical protein
MDFVTGLSRTRLGHNAVWVIIDTLTKVAYFILFRLGTSTEDMGEVVPGLAVPTSWSTYTDHLRP